jgi:hypothetical protein
MYQKYKKY